MIFITSGFKNSAEIIWYDFKHQTMDLMNDVNIWANLEILKGMIDPKNSFSGKILEKMD